MSVAEFGCIDHAPQGTPAFEGRTIAAVTNGESADEFEAPPREPRITTPGLITLAIIVFGLMLLADPPEPILLKHSILAFALGFTPWFLFAAIVALDRRGRPGAGREITSILGLSVFVSIMPALSFGAWINASWDRSEPRVELVEARYVELVSRSQGRTRKHVIVASELVGQREVTLEIRADELEISDPDALRGLRLTLRDGAFGWPYFTDIEIEP